MGRATCIVTSELRARLYDLVARSGPRDIWILYDKPWGCEGRLIELDPPTIAHGPMLHFLEIISDKLDWPGDNGHVDVVLNERGLRFKRDADV